MISLLSLLLALPTARAETELYAPIQVGFELGSLHVADPNWDLFNSDTDALPTRGLRVGYAFNDKISAIAGWHHGARGQDIYVGEDESTEFRAAYNADLFMLGAKGSLPLLSWAQPYATLQAQALRSVVRLDDDTSDTENLNQIQRNAFAPGGTVGGGLDILMPFDYGEWALTTNLEFDYSYFAPSSFDDLGDVQMKGFTFRWGVGARF